MGQCWWQPDRYRDHAQATWDAGCAAMYQIDDIVKSEDLACDFAWVPGYLHAPWGNPSDQIKRLRNPELEPFCLSLLDGVIAHLGEIDRRLAETAENWRVSRMTGVDRKLLESRSGGP